MVIFVISVEILGLKCAGTSKDMRWLLTISKVLIRFRYLLFGFATVGRQFDRRPPENCLGRGLGERGRLCHCGVLGHWGQYAQASPPHVSSVMEQKIRLAHHGGVGLQALLQRGPGSKVHRTGSASCRVQGGRCNE